MRARGRTLDRLAHGEEAADLRGRERVARLHRGLAGHHVDDLVERGLEGHERTVLDGLLEEVAHERARVGVARMKQCRHGLDGDRARPERARLDAKPREQRRDLAEDLDLARAPLEHDGNEEALRLERPAVHPLEERREHRALVQRVLVDDDDAVGVFGHHEAVEELDVRELARENRLVGRAIRLWFREAGRQRCERAEVDASPCVLVTALRCESAAEERRARARIRLGGRAQRIGHKARHKVRRTQRALDRLAHGRVDGRLRSEAHLALRGVDIHIDLARVELEDERHRRRARGVDKPAVRLAHGVQHRAVHDRAAVQVDADRARRWTRDAGLAGEAAHDEAAELWEALLELEELGRELGAEDIERALRGFGGRREVEQPPAVRPQFERHRRMRERQRLDRLGDARRLGRVRLQELAPRGHIEEERTHLDHGARARGRRPHGADRAAFDLDLGAARRAAQTRLHPEARDARNRGKRLAAETEGVDRREIVARRHLARRVRGDRERELGLGDSPAIVGDAHEFGAAALDLDQDRARAGVDRVLDEFLHHARGAFDDLAGGDLVHEFGWQDADRHVTNPTQRGSDSGARDRMRAARA